jgi:uncharacterized protein
VEIVSQTYEDANKLPTILPMFPLSRVLLLPRGELPLNIFEPRYLAMTDAAIGGARMIGMIQPLPGEDESDGPPRLHSIGCLGSITRFSETGDGRYLITLTGVCRFRVEAEVTQDTPYRNCRVSYDEFIGDLDAGAGEDKVNRSQIVDTLRKFADISQFEVDWASIDAAPTETLVNALAMMSPFGAREKQILLEASSLDARAQLLVAIAEIDLAHQPGGERPQFH